MTNTNEDLVKQIEQLVTEHVAACRRAARDAVERGFATAGGMPVVAARRGKRVTAGAKSGKRRGAADLAALGERFYRAVCAKPGETMTVLAMEAGASARELHRAVMGLKRSGRVRVIGQRSQTRYFPRTSGAAA